MTSAAWEYRPSRSTSNGDSVGPPNEPVAWSVERPPFAPVQDVVGLDRRNDVVPAGGRVGRRVVHDPPAIGPQHHRAARLVAVDQLRVRRMLRPRHGVVGCGEVDLVRRHALPPAQTNVQYRSSWTTTWGAHSNVSSSAS